ncbi:MAG: hypothetical protein M5E90_04335 [Asgard group archaeon]|nr:hypothetical protein [Asgard group archaeon]
MSSRKSISSTPTTSNSKLRSRKTNIQQQKQLEQTSPIEDKLELITSSGTSMESDIEDFNEDELYKDELYEDELYEDELYEDEPYEHVSELSSSSYSASPEPLSSNTPRYKRQKKTNVVKEVPLPSKKPTKKEHGNQLDECYISCTINGQQRNIPLRNIEIDEDSLQLFNQLKFPHISRELKNKEETLKVNNLPGNALKRIINDCEADTNEIMNK